jgi:rod shape-determining protein MreC
MMKSSKGKLKTSAILFILIALFVLANIAGFSKNIRSFFYSFSSPIQEGLWAAGANISDFFVGTFNGGKLKAENERLISENQELKLRLLDMASLKQENETLRGAIDSGVKTEFRLFLARIVGKDTGTDSIMIDKGAQDGLSPGLSVITSQKVLIGKISEVFPKYSKVELITNPDLSFGVRVGEKNILGEAKGAGNLRMVLEKVSKEATLTEGEMVLSTSLGGIFPQGLLVGQIKNIKKNDTESFQKAEIDSAFDINELNNIFVIVN